MMSSRKGGGNCLQSRGEKKESAGKASTVEEKGNLGRLMKDIYMSMNCSHLVRSFKGFILRKTSLRVLQVMTASRSNK